MLYNNPAILVSICCMLLVAFSTRKKGLSREEKEIQRLNLELKRRKLEEMLRDGK